MEFWFHVTPLFLLPAILKSGGFRCGADLSGVDSPRRHTSRDDDDQPVKGLGGRRPADFVLLFIEPNPPLLRAKLSGRPRKGEPGKAYPHVRFDLNPLKCFEVSKWEVYGSVENVGRTLRKGQEPVIKVYRSRQQVREAHVSEIMLPADVLRDRTLPLTVVSRIMTFSDPDYRLVQEHLRRIPSDTRLDLKPNNTYALGQTEGDGRKFSDQTRALFEAIWSGDDQLQAQLTAKLAEQCFD